MQEKSLIVGGRGVKRNTNFMKVKDEEGASYYFDGKLEDAKVEFEYRRKMK